MRLAPDYSFLFPTLLGVAAIAVGLSMAKLQPKGAFNGFKSPILAFEFARTPADVTAIQRDFSAVSTQPFGATIDRANRVDMAFLTLYGLFLATFCLLFGRYRQQPVLGYIGAVLAIAAAGFDFLENQQMFAISARLQAGSYEPFLQKLNLFTRLKWGLVPVLMLVLLPLLWQGGPVAKGLALLAVVSVVLGALAVVPGHPTAVAVQRFATSVFLLFLLVLVYALLLSLWGAARPRWL